MPTSSPTQARDARLEARISAADKALLERAARLTNRKLSEFVLASAQKEAAAVIAAHEAIVLTQAEQMAFVQALLQPPAAHDRLRQAARSYRQRTGL
jgi:uncharacterized protein (DUF1778 family)